MAKTNTTLSVAATADARDVTVTSATGATVGGFLKMDEEYSFIQAISGTRISLTQRGALSSRAVAHAVLAPVCFGLLSDLPSDLSLSEPSDREYKSIGANGAIACPTKNTTYFINKGSALASSTLAQPGAEQNGLEVTFVGATDYAHVVSIATGADGTTGNHTTLTSPAYKGGSLTLVAYQATWLVKANNLWVIS